MTDLVTILTNFGFPIALSVYLLLRFEKTLADLTKINTELVNKNTLLVGQVQEQSKNISDLRELLLKGRKQKWYGNRSLNHCYM